MNFFSRKKNARDEGFGISHCGKGVHVFLPGRALCQCGRPPYVKQEDLIPIETKVYKDIVEPRSVYKEELYDGMAPERTVKRFAFDVDGTLIRKTRQGDMPRYEIIQLAFTLASLGHTVFVWSGGGKEYATAWADKIGLSPFIRVLEKSKNYDIDVAFDDHAVDLAEVNVVV